MSILGSSYAYRPGTHALVVELVDYPGGYSWDAVGIFRRRSDGALFYASDSGCSCHGPWDLTVESELEPLTFEALPALEIAAHFYRDITARQDFIRTAQSLVAGK